MLASAVGSKRRFQERKAMGHYDGEHPNPRARYKYAVIPYFDLCGYKAVCGRGFQVTY